MSHLKERKEKNCLNCGAEVQGRYCQVCGQENIEPKESFWHLVTHFMYDITHFDGKFFSTLKYLLFRPGYLSHEYLRGRRASYLHPIRMYVFTSAFFFLIFFSTKKSESVIQIDDSPTAAQLMKKLEKRRTKLSSTLVKDSVLPALAKAAMEVKLSKIDSDIALLTRDTTAKDKLQSLGTNDYDNFNVIGNFENNSKTLREYDSIQSHLPKADRDGFLKRRLARQNLHLKEKYNHDSRKIMDAIIEKFKHLFPQMLFISLPLFALALQLLYARRKKFFYVNHVVYTIHLYCGTFIIILAGMGLDGLFSLLHLPDQNWVGGVFSLVAFFYWYKSQRNFYEQRRGKTIAKYLIVLSLSFFIMIMLFVLFFIFSAMSI